MAYTTGTGLAAKLTTSLIHVVLAQYLVPKDFGIFAVCFGIVKFAEISSKLGFRDILIKNSNEFERISGAIYSLSTILGIASTAILLAMSPYLAQVFDASEQVGVLRAAAFAPVFTAMSIVPIARLEMSFRYPTIGWINWATVVIRGCLSIAFVVMGLGVFSLVIATIAASAGQTLMATLSCGRFPIRPNTDRKLLAMIARASPPLLGASLLATAVSQGDYLILGALSTAEEVGVYFAAFAIGYQVIMLIAMNISSVLMPAFSLILSRGGDPSDAYVQTVKLAVLVASPICFLQAVLSGSIVKLLLRPEFFESAMPMGILCAGLFFRVMSFPAIPLIKSQGRFTTVFIIQLISAIQILGLAAIGSQLWGATGCATGVAVGSVLTGHMASYVAVDGSRTRYAKVLGTVYSAMSLALPSAATIVLIGVGFPSTRLGALLHIGLGGGLGMMLYLALVAWIMPKTTRLAVERTSGLWERFPYLRVIVKWVNLKLKYRLEALEHREMLR